MKKSLAFAAMCILCACFPSVMFAAGGPLSQINKIKSGKVEGPIKIRSASLEHIRGTNTFTGSGFVDVVYGGIHIQSERMKLNGNTGELVAEGSVILDDVNGRMTGEKVFYNLKKKTGKIINGRAFIKPYYYFKGEVIERLSEEHFVVKKGYYTPCSQPVPHWSLRMGKADIELEKYARMYDFSFRIGETPIFYFPYAIFPARTKRASGLLTPHVAYSAWRGFELFQPYYWNINPWSDATITLDYKSNMGVGGAGEYRYKYTKNDWGRFYGYYFQEIDKQLPNAASFDAEGEDRARWNIFSDVVQTIPLGIKTITHVERYSDKDFPRVFSDMVQDRKLREEDSYFFADKNTETDSISVMTRRIRDMQPGTTLILEKLPEINWTHISSRILNTPLYFRSEALYNYYTRDNKFNPPPGTYSGPAPDSDYRVQRFFVNPEVSMPISLPWGMMLNPKAGYMGTIYSRSSEKKEVFERHILRFDVDFSGPALYSVSSFDNLWNIEKIQHIIQPKISYHYVPRKNQDKLFSFVDSADPNAVSTFRIDNLDFIAHQNFLRFSLKNFFSGKFSSIKTAAANNNGNANNAKTDVVKNNANSIDGVKTEEEVTPDALPVYKKIASFDIGADINFLDYDFENYDLNDALRVIGRDSNTPYSYLFYDAEFSLFPSFSIASTSYFNLDKERLETFNVALAYNYGFLQLNGKYRHTIDLASTRRTADVLQDENNFLTGNATLRLSDRWHVTTNTVWNLDSAKALETRLGVNYIRKCWNANFLFITRNNNNNEFHLFFNLLTLGAVGI